MRIAICEDDAGDVRQLTDMLTRYLKENSLEADVDVFSSGEAFLAAFSPGKYQIVFMDIYMKDGGMTGVGAAREATAADRDVAVIFITNSEAHLQEGYNYAVYYIVKPYDDEWLALAMGKCRAQIERYAKTIEVTADRLPVRIRLRDIYQIESVRHSFVFKLAAHDITVAEMAFDSLENQLGGHPFFRCHRSYIVNLLHVKKLAGNDFVMENGSLTPVGRSFAAKARRVIAEFLRKRIQGDVM